MAKVTPTQLRAKAKKMLEAEEKADKKAKAKAKMEKATRGSAAYLLARADYLEAGK